MKYSIIVPVYNAEKYVKECIDSIIMQTYRDFEVIIVNDGSTDGTRNVLNEYEGLQNVRIIDCVNQGASKARWTGIERAIGEYVLFVDSDDIVSQKLLATVENAMQEDIDLLKFSFVSFSKNNFPSNRKTKAEETVFNREKFLSEVVEKTIVNGSEAVVLWNKVYKRSLINEYVNRFPYSFLEDYIFNCEYYVAVNKYKQISDELYFYRYLPDSLSRQINPKGYDILKEVDRFKITAMQKMGLTSSENLQNAAAWFVNYLINGYLFNACRLNAFDKRSLLNILSDPVLNEKCRLVGNTKYDSKEATFIRNQKHNKVLFGLRLRVVILKIKKTIRNLRV